MKQWDRDSDGNLEAQYTRHIEYDRRGNPVIERAGFDFNSEGSPTTEITSYEYKKGMLVMKSYLSDLSNDDKFTYGWIERYTYDKNRELREKVYEEDENLDGSIDQRKTWSYQNGKIVREEIQSPDWDDDGIPDYRYVTEYKYDFEERLIESYKKSYIYGTEDSAFYVKINWIYNEKGLLTQYILDDTERMDYILTWNYQYDTKDQLIMEIHHDEFDHGEDGRLVTKYIYNNRGLLIREEAGILSISDWDEADLQAAVRYEYNRKGNLTEKEVLASFGDIREKLALYEWKYDHKGRVIEDSVWTDTDGIAGYDKQDVKRYAYDRKDDLIKELHDNDNNGTYEWIYSKFPVNDAAFADCSSAASDDLWDVSLLA